MRRYEKGRKSELGFCGGLVRVRNFLGAEIIGIQGTKTQNEKQFSGCLGRMVDLFDLGNGNKLLTDIPHNYGSPLSRSCSDVVSTLSARIGVGDHIGDKMPSPTTGTFPLPHLNYGGSTMLNPVNPAFEDLDNKSDTFKFQLHTRSFGGFPMLDHQLISLSQQICQRMLQQRITELFPALTLMTCKWFTLMQLQTNPSRNLTIQCGEHRGPPSP